MDIYRRINEPQIYVEFVIEIPFNRVKGKLIKIDFRKFHHSSTIFRSW
jgi:hypothetical protein